MPKNPSLINIVLIGLVPFVFACSKSKFSAKKQEPSTGQQVNQPRVDTDQSQQEFRPPVLRRPPVRQQEPRVIVEREPRVIVEREPRVVVEREPRVVEQPTCFETPDYQLDGFEYGAQGVNLWLVVDSSKSFENDRVAATKALIDTYVHGLARQIPVTFSVITGHSDESPDSVNYRNRMTNFFYRQGNEPSVIKFVPNMSASQKTAARDQLIRKITQMRVDNSRGISDGGELLINNLTNALHSERLAWAQSVGAFSPKNALGIIFMSDENDICTPTKGLPGHKPDGNRTRDTDGKIAANEDVAYRRYCGGVDQGVTAINTLQRLKQAKHLNYLFASGIVYTGEGPIPAGGEDEEGHGFVQFIQALNGTAFDLSGLRSGSRDRWAQQKAQELAKITNKSANLYVRHQIKHNGSVLPLSDVDFNRDFRVKVDGKEVPRDQLLRNSNTNHLLIPGCGPKSRIQVHYCVNKGSNYAQASNYQQPQARYAPEHNGVNPPNYFAPEKKRLHHPTDIHETDRNYNGR